MRDLRIIEAAFGTPWAIHEQKGQVLLAVLRAHMRGTARVTAHGARAESAARDGARRDARLRLLACSGADVRPFLACDDCDDSDGPAPSTGYVVSVSDADLQAATGRTGSAPPANIGVLPLHGVMMPRGNFLNDGSGSLSLEGARAIFRQMESDPTVDAIILDIDSPGGQVFSVPEFANEIRAARKMVVAQAWDWAASAAYFVGSAASRLVCTPSGMVGSIGVFEVHVDASDWYANEGLKPTMIKAGKFKAEFNDFGPLSDEAAAYEQGQVDAYHTMFVRAVAKGRRVSVDAVRETFGQGRMVMADEALRLGMIDEIATFEQTVAKVAREIQAKKREQRAEETVRLSTLTAIALEEESRRIAA